jgi:hypothetical protein
LDLKETEFIIEIHGRLYASWGRGSACPAHPVSLAHSNRHEPPVEKIVYLYFLLKAITMPLNVLFSKL